MFVCIRLVHWFARVGKKQIYLQCGVLATGVGVEQGRVKQDRCELKQDHRCRVHLMRWRKLCGLKISHLLLLHTDWSFSGHYTSAARIPPSRMPLMISPFDRSLTVVTVSGVIFTPLDRWQNREREKWRVAPTPLQNIDGRSLNVFNLCTLNRSSRLCWPPCAWPPECRESNYCCLSGNGKSVSTCRPW